ncbi:FixH family protein [Thalassobacillus sp. CUG 92003]|uniref:FixH family protein n=1 Tax=Thalassobacillus sp. CUG 92003 TaxID=2736641 RepID=UPI0015E73CDE|nr:FixH family protein [Thalassobacillus sp. CUG 92003]
MKKLLCMSFIFLLFTSACGSQAKDDSGSSNAESNGGDSEALAMVETEITLAPDQPEPNKQTSIEATVTQDGEAVNDADEVEFEIWKKNASKDNSKMLSAESTGNGVYQAEFTFPSKGTYNITAHTTARDMHVMPTKTVTIGSPNKETAEDDSEEDSESHAHGDDNFAIHVMTDKTFTAKTESELIAHIQKDEEPFQQADVRFEVSSDQSKNEKFIDAAESDDGKYSAGYTFPASGNYTVKVHIEKGDIHTHKKESITVE